MGKNNGSARREQKRESAKSRQIQYASLNPKEKLTQIDKMFGIGKGAKKQRAKINEQILRVTEKNVKKEGEVVKKVGKKI
jgi:hypothetical protein